MEKTKRKTIEQSSVRKGSPMEGVIGEGSMFLPIVWQEGFKQEGWL